MTTKILIGTFVASILGNMARAYVVLFRYDADCKAKYERMVQAYVFLERAQVYLLNLLMKHQADLANLMSEHKDMTKEQFEEAVRRKIVTLEMETKDFETCK